jgi:hypothetical protein
MSGGTDEAGRLTRKVLEYDRVMRGLAQTVRTPSDWAPLEEFVATEDFERIGTFLEAQNWAQYTEMLTQWASSIKSFETTVRRISELANLVYYEIEERHHRGGTVSVVNSMTVFDFGGDEKIHSLAVYLQQPPPTKA